jgi:hypothetical protein
MNKTDSTMETARMTTYYRLAYSELIGRKVIDVRSMYPEEMELFLWDGEPGCVLILDDGGMVIPMRDEEGNGPGQLLIREGKKR